MYDNVLLLIAASWEFQVDAKLEEMSEEVHVSEVSVGKRVCMFHDLAWAASFDKMVDIFLVIKTLLLYVVLLIITQTDPPSPTDPAWENDRSE